MAGIDHRTEIGLREGFAFTTQTAGAFLDFCRHQPGVAEAVLLTTCGRTELWLAGEADPGHLLTAGVHKSLPVTACARDGPEAIRHLHRLACGLASQIPGDEQIVGQIRQAAESAGEACGPLLDRLFRSAVTAGKRARALQGPRRTSLSIADQAVRRVAEHLGGLQGRRVLLVGSGAMGRQAAQALRAGGASVWMTWRKKRPDAAGRPETAAEKVLREEPPHPQPTLPDVTMVRYEERYAVMAHCDAVIGATACPHPVIRFGDMQAVTKRPLLFVDIALPRDVEPEVGQMEGVTLLDLDHLGAVPVDPVWAADREAIADEAAHAFRDWMDKQAGLADLHAIHAFARHRLACLPGVTAAQQAVLDRRLGRMLDALLFGVREREGHEAYLRISRSLASSIGAEEDGHDPCGGTGSGRGPADDALGGSRAGTVRCAGGV